MFIVIQLFYNITVSLGERCVSHHGSANQNAFDVALIICGFDLNNVCRYSIRLKN